MSEDLAVDKVSGIPVDTAKWDQVNGWNSLEEKVDEEVAVPERACV